MLIYQLVFGTDSGQVLCCFHDDSRASAGIGPNGEYNCFACGAKAHDETGFIAKYFGVGLNRASKIKNSLERLQGYKYSKNKLSQEQIEYLRSIGISDAVMHKYFFQSSIGKLIYNHTWNGIDVGYTWFNHQSLSTYSASAPKYKYDKNCIAGSLTPYDDVIRYNTLIICEGEKDMLTAKSMGIPNAVAKIGGAASYILGGVNFHNKQIVICYDCDDPGREYAIRDADILTERFACKVKIIDLGLAHGEDLNDYFIKYGKTKNDFYNLITSTPIHVLSPKTTQSKLEKFIATLSADEIAELMTEFKNIIEKRKGEFENE